MPSKIFIDQEIINENNMNQFISAEDICYELKRNCKILMLDCRNPTEYSESHIRGAINLTLPTILLRRLCSGKLTVPSAIKDNEERERFVMNWKTHTIILCGEGSITDCQNSLLTTIYNRLSQEGCYVLYLEGGFKNFRAHYPEWCYIGSQTHLEPESPILGLQNLRISSPLAPIVNDATPTRDAQPFPVEILPFLYLGNARTSMDAVSLERHNIQYILNVTPDLPNVFESLGVISYLQIPITDHWSENLAYFFPKAIAFIDQARKQQKGVLVHCLGGISRSVTITLAYLMQSLTMTLNDAYDFVRQRKGDISPNFNFMGQLMEYERYLHLSSSQCACGGSSCSSCKSHFLSPVVHSSSDSGVDCDSSCESWVM